MGFRRDRRGPPTITTAFRVNHQIRIRQVRVIDDLGNQLGVLETVDALALAKERGLDLVEVAANQRPPVCRILDFGKFKYEQKKKEHASKRRQHQTQIKEVRVRPNIATNDVAIKTKKARTFLEDGDKVLVNCLFRGRQMAHQEVGRRVLDEVLELLKDIAKVERPPSMEGRRMTMLLSKR
jgi:translation initiation factor IF-3